MAQPHTKPGQRHPGEPWKPRKQVNIRVSDATLALLDAVREQDGVPYSAQVERAMKMYAASKGITLTPPGPVDPAQDGGQP